MSRNSRTSNGGQQVVLKPKDPVTTLGNSSHIARRGTAPQHRASLGQKQAEEARAECLALPPCGQFQKASAPACLPGGQLCKTGKAGKEVTSTASQPWPSPQDHKRRDLPEAKNF